MFQPSLSIKRQICKLALSNLCFKVNCKFFTCNTVNNWLHAFTMKEKFIFHFTCVLRSEASCIINMHFVIQAETSHHLRGTTVVISIVNKQMPALFDMMLGSRLMRPQSSLSARRGRRATEESEGLWEGEKGKGATPLSSFSSALALPLAALLSLIERRLETSQGSRGGVVMRALASHYSGPSSNLGPDVMWLSLLLVPFLL